MNISKYLAKVNHTGCEVAESLVFTEDHYIL